MKITPLAVAALLLASFAAVASAADTKKLLPGKWEAVKVDEGTLPKGAIVEFGANGKLSVTAKKGDQEATLDGTYTVDGDSFTYKFNIEGKERSEKITVKSISETEMDTTNSEGKKVMFKRVK